MGFTQRTVDLKDCLKSYTRDLDKAISPQETLETFYSRVAALDLKIVNSVKRIDSGRLGIPVYFSVCGEDAAALTGTKKQMGKGASPQQAEASACMELVERFSFFAYKNEETNFFIGDYQQALASGHPVLDLQYLLQSVDDKETSSKTLASLLEGIPMQWAWGLNVTTGQQLLVPFSWFFAINEFNGSSAGNTLEEAALQGLCEVVERHVCALVNRQKRQVPKIAPASLKNPVAKELVRLFQDRNIELQLYDFSLDTGISTVAALAIDRTTFPQRSEIVFTAGTSPDPAKAAIRAITEVAQLAGDFDTDSKYIASGLPKPASVDEVAYLSGGKKEVSIADIANLSDDNIKDEFLSCVAAIQKLAMDVLVLDVSDERLNIPACYVIVPGAAFRERAASGDAGLFAARLAQENIGYGPLLEAKLAQMDALLPDAYYLDFYRGQNQVSLGDHEAALRHFSRALQREPAAEDLPSIASFMGCCLKDLGRYEEAVKILAQGLQVDEQRPDLHNSLGVCWFKLEDYRQAIAHFHRAVELNPASAMDYANLGVNYDRLGEKAKAIEYLTVAVTLDAELDFARDLLTQLIS
ncbi:MAG: hypothetical protein CSA20_02915 [Deltaproteobacteria bacterium]|nr:MAG: hypothetical protein CSB23_05135 [Deltaproteobacteria bacterium]PIE73457.1 MAG: hypothetical protein CSA20_02915 [Deltaproteobacteria bacterium]